MSKENMNETTIEMEPAQLIPGYTPCVLDVHRTSFTKKIQFAEIGANELDRKVVSSGAKLVIGGHIPKLFKTPITKAQKLLEEECLRFGDHGWLIPDAKLEKVKKELMECRKTFHFHKMLLRNGYANFVEEHARNCDSNPDLPTGFGDLIRSQCHPWSYVDEQLQFEFKIINDIKKAMAYDFLDSVAKEAQEHLNQIMATAKANSTAPKLTKKNHDRLLAFKNRMESVVMLEPKAQYVIDVIDQFTTEREAPYSNQDVRDLILILAAMANKDYFLFVAELEGDQKTYTLAQLQDNLPKNIKLTF